MLKTLLSLLPIVTTAFVCGTMARTASAQAAPPKYPQNACEAAGEAVGWEGVVKITNAFPYGQQRYYLRRDNQGKRRYPEWPSQGESYERGEIKVHILKPGGEQAASGGVVEGYAVGTWKMDEPLAAPDPDDGDGGALHAIAVAVDAASCEYSISITTPLQAYTGRLVPPGATTEGAIADPQKATSPGAVVKATTKGGETLFATLAKAPAATVLVLKQKITPGSALRGSLASAEVAPAASSCRTWATTEVERPTCKVARLDATSCCGFPARFDAVGFHTDVEWELTPIRKFDIQIGTFIPYDFVPRGGPPLGPDGMCSVPQTPFPVHPAVPDAGLLFRGDLKVGVGYGRPEAKLFDFASNAFRTQKRLSVLADGTLHADLPAVANESKAYASDAAKDGVIDDTDDDSTLNDCHLLHMIGRDQPVSTVTVSPLGEYVVRVDVAGHGTLPLIRGAPAIDYEYVVVIDASRPEAIYTVDAMHDGFPAHELYINGKLLYGYDPRTFGDTPLALFPPLERRGTVTCAEFSKCDPFGTAP